jgi:hypothetical protein
VARVGPLEKLKIENGPFTATWPEISTTPKRSSQTWGLTAFYQADRSGLSLIKSVHESSRDFLNIESKEQDFCR